MSKRFTDTEKWKKQFFRGLQAPYKLVWLYILDECNHAGIWELEFDVLKIRTGINCSPEEIIKVFGEKIISFDNGKKWFIEDFISFQYGELNEKNNVHKSVLTLLSIYRNKGLICPLQGAKDKDEEEDKDKNKDNNEEYKNFISLINKILNRTFKGTKKDKGQFNARRNEGYTMGDFEKAILNASKDQYHIDNPKHLTPEFITRADKLEKWLNAQPSKKEFDPSQIKSGPDYNVYEGMSEEEIKRWENK